MSNASDKLFENGNRYRLHQDILRWTLLAGYAAFLVGVLSLDTKPDGFAGAALVGIGLCYMLILAVENFFYNLFAEYVKDCESRIASGNSSRTLKEFSAAESANVGPFHHSFFFALLIVVLGNAIVASGISKVALRRGLYIADGACFLLILLGWRALVFPWIVLPVQRIFDVSDPDKNWLWKVLQKMKIKKSRTNESAHS